MAIFTYTPAVVVLTLLCFASPALSSQAGNRANPIRRVVDLLQSMQKKVAEEGKAEEALFDKFMCWCSTGGGDLKASISAAETKIPQVTSSLASADALKKQLALEIAQHKQDRADAKGALAEATALREKEAGIYAKDSSDLKTNIAALGSAIDALEKGVYGSFLQTAQAAKLRQLTLDVDMSSFDRQMVSSFLTQGQDQGYVPQSEQIIGILKQMKDTMEAGLADITNTEHTAISDFEALSAAKEKEIAANSEAIEAKLMREGQTGLEIVALQEDLDDTSKALAEDKIFLKNLEGSCETKKAEWKARSTERSEEILAIADTIKILNDDDSLELFKKTLPTPALLQTAVSSKAVKREALKALGTHRDTRLELIAVALRGGAKSFEKVTKMIDEMVALLGKEQTADDEKKAYCLATLDKTDDEKKSLEQTEADLEKALEEANEAIATLQEEIEALEAGIAQLDKDVAEATATREAENKLYVDTMAADNAAKDVMGIAKNRLAKFYNPKLYKPPPKIELTAEERVYVNEGMTLAPTAPPGGIAGTGVTVLAQVRAHSNSAETVAPAPPPATWSAYSRKNEEHLGVVEMMNMLIADLDKEIQEMTVDEKDAQAEYEQFVKDAAAKRATDAAAVASKEGAKASLEAEVAKMGGEKKATVAALMAKEEEIKDLHLACDWLLANFEARKAARAGEVESLKQAKAVLSGADYSLVQTVAVQMPMLRGAHY